MTDKKSLFGTSGIRGHAEDLFTEQFCIDIASSFIEFLKRKSLLGPIAVGLDPRPSSPRIKLDLMKGLGAAQVPLFDEGITPIPSMNWLMKNTEVAAGIMITGSHIDIELNGVKFYAHDEEISVEDQNDIEEIYYEIQNKEKPEMVKAVVTNEDRAKKMYGGHLKSLVDGPLPQWRVAVDCANGAQSVVMPQLLRDLGLRVLEVNCNPEGANFIARDTDTDDKAGIEDLKKAVKDEGQDFGIAFDGDGDRVVFVDEKGEFVQGEYSCSLIAKETPDHEVVTTISASQVVDEIGKKIVRTKVGSPYVVGKMKELGVSFGFEPNGGAIFGDYMYTRDGGTMTIKMLNLFAKRNHRPFSELIGELPKYYMSRTKVDYKWELKDKIIEGAKEKFKGVKVEEVDGLKIWVDNNTWILFRSSANAPEFRVFAESKTEAKSQKLLEDGIAYVNEMISNG